MLRQPFSAAALCISVSLPVFLFTFKKRAVACKEFHISPSAPCNTSYRGGRHRRTESMEMYKKEASEDRGKPAAQAESCRFTAVFHSGCSNLLCNFKKGLAVFTSLVEWVEKVEESSPGFTHNSTLPPAGGCSSIQMNLFPDINQQIYINRCVEW